jgi:hypothetical protein
MTKKNWLLVVFLIALGAVYVIWFTDWFKPRTIHVFHTIRDVHFRRRAADEGSRLIFGVEPAEIKLTEIKVVPLADFQKNPETLPLWHLVTDSNSAPVKDFIYGQRIRGMRPSIAGAEAGPLQTNIVYRIFVKSGRARGQHDFEIGGTPAESTTGSNNP